MLQKIGKLLAVALLAMGFGGAMAAAPAQAALSDCNNGYVCIWTGYNYSGTVSQWTPGWILQNTAYGCKYLTGSQNNTTTSIYNNSGTGVRFYYMDYCSPDHGYYFMQPGGRITFASSDSRNDVISSIKVCYPTC